ncbi:MAG: CO dehydrogenase/acetyl-CoA synthase complex subunit epsilon [Candidatus Methanoliparum thermophilum]|uniref:Acetyl-CoA decarbonylase/synthase complex subunit epsilon n=1 Tax=Methanoliparum thermophilum TaxID=2491083 RepID=A0A520KT44_METT2|nr:CO dehydrogenase/acetyl-CoA synthase complex subunit epsilon [Candidatus Methanoliparum sp. LAM-1]RZN65072.1 MAG: CO dehydrogenase/acetyl-CoA synthase complex subunit epsilon [Candidatus Methanoliparum thermophilum]BDC36035.1 acetyl-CoA synthase subunit beta [Candidatus Methanoliparum sp. LAM-1]
MAELKMLPFDAGNIPGPKMGRVTAPKIIGKMIKRAKKPLLICGSNIEEHGSIDKAIEIGKKGIPIAASGNAIVAFRNKGYMDNVKYVLLNDLANCLRDPEWKGLDGKGNYDTVIFIGSLYYLTSGILASLKNFVPHIKALAIDPYYQPNADMTFGDIWRKKDEYLAMLDEVIGEL